MSKKRETLFRAKAMAELKKLPNLVAFSIQQQALRGTPDVLACISGHFVAIEFKASETSPVSELQKFYINKINESGGHGYVAYPENWKYVFNNLKQIALGVPLNDKIEKQILTSTKLQ